ncbi:MAG: hypothetical protein JW908_05760 [Anaerolineales bacterium]|nr:hypothetical protein [Anaerolineales bacterium]
MSIRQISYQLEISFWWKIIPWMSGSHTLRKAIEIYQQVTREIDWKPFVKLILFCSSTSLMLGVILGILSAL